MRLLALPYLLVVFVWMIFFKTSNRILNLIGLHLSVDPRRIKSAWLWGIIVGVIVVFIRFEGSYLHAMFWGILATLCGFVIMNIEFKSSTGY